MMAHHISDPSRSITSQPSLPVTHQHVWCQGWPGACCGQRRARPKGRDAPRSNFLAPTSPTTALIVTTTPKNKPPKMSTRLEAVAPKTTIMIASTCTRVRQCIQGRCWRGFSKSGRQWRAQCTAIAWRRAYQVKDADQPEVLRRQTGRMQNGPMRH